MATGGQKKRGQNEGSIFRRKNGKWAGAVTIPGSGGKRKWFSGDTQRAVREQVTAARVALDRGESLTMGKLTVGQFLERWLRDVVQPNKAPKTHRTYAGLVRRNIAPGIGGIQLDRLRPQDVQRLLTDLAGGDLAGKAASLQRVREVLRNALNQALRWELVARNAAALVEPPKYERPSLDPFTPAEARAFLAAAAKDRTSGIYLVAMALGLRQGEVLGLRWEAVDLAAGTLRVEAQVQVVEGKLTLREVKTKRSRRELPIPDIVRRALVAEAARQHGAMLKAGERWQGNAAGLVFTTTVGTPISPRNLMRSYYRILAASGLRLQRFHDLRHFCGSTLAARRVPERQVMEILGHADVRTTQNYYIHVRTEEQRRAVKEMDELLG
ncbi:MAG TPA: tyrosine-type recombinase/integrase [Nitrolancea sp.]|nr:tyrosine-type recombinase/integrase [Nitrolancea sp.]